MEVLYFLNKHFMFKGVIYLNKTNKLYISNENEGNN